MFYKNNAIYRIDENKCFINLENRLVKPFEGLLAYHFPDTKIMVLPDFDILTENMNPMLYNLIKYTNGISETQMIITMNDITSFEFALTIKQLLDDIPIKYYSIQETVDVIKIRN